ncbi:hypothetical protein STEG23_032424, partial [Scotinomys teguina]
MARKAGQGKEEEESRTRQQEEKTPVRDEEKKPACHGRGHHVVEQEQTSCPDRMRLNPEAPQEPTLPRFISFWSLQVTLTPPVSDSFLAILRDLHSRPKKPFFLGDEEKLKDWHDQEAIKRDSQRVGNGEQGKPYPMTDAERVDQAYRENGFNIYVSDKISLNRSLPDIRHPNCNSKRYLETLPNTSIIIPFHNEGWSSLLRTVHSVLNRSPPELVAEIVLVDDFSDR